MDRGPAEQRWDLLPRDCERGEYFEVMAAATREFYLADSENPYQQSGRRSGADRWEETRRCIANAVYRNGDFCDVGCANGLLLETLMSWSAERGFSIRPHGIDLIPELVELAQQRHPTHRSSFEVANAFFWEPRRQYDYVRTNIEYVPTADCQEFLDRQFRLAVKPGGRFIVCHYSNPGESCGIAAAMQRTGLAVCGQARAPGVGVAWVDKRE